MFGGGIRIEEEDANKAEMDGNETLRKGKPGLVRVARVARVARSRRARYRRKKIAINTGGSCPVDKPQRPLSLDSLLRN